MPTYLPCFGDFFAFAKITLDFQDFSLQRWKEPLNLHPSQQLDLRRTNPSNFKRLNLPLNSRPTT